MSHVFLPAKARLTSLTCLTCFYPRKHGSQVSHAFIAHRKKSDADGSALWDGPNKTDMSTYDHPEAREERLYRRILNDTYRDMDELRLRYDAQTKLVEALEARVDALQKLDTVARALVIAQDVIIAQQRQIDRVMHAMHDDSPEPQASSLGKVN